MIILITGASHSGKTKLAQRLLEKYKYPYLSIDHLKMGLIRSGSTALTPEQDKELVPYLWNIVREIIKTNIENKQNLIVEGCYVPFDWEKDFAFDYLRQIRFICLCMSDKYIENNYNEIISHSSDIEKRLDNSYCTIEGLKADNQSYISGCEKYGLDYILIDESYDELNRIIGELKKGL